MKQTKEGRIAFGGPKIYSEVKRLKLGENKAG
jgi:hypothetical protein